MSEPKVTYKDVWECLRCGKIKEPCPRGGCEAIIVGQKTITTITEYKKYSPKELEEANMERGSIYYNSKPRKGLFTKRKGDGKTGT